MLASRAHSIERKLSLAVLVAVTIAVVVGACASAWRETERRYASQRDLIQGTALTVAASVAAPLAAGDQIAIARSINVLRTLPRIRYGVVLDRDGSHVFEVGTGIVLGDQRESLAANLPVGVFGSLRLGTYLASVPVVFGGERIGTLALVADLTELQHALVESVGEAIVAGMIAALLALAAVTKLKRTIAAPILALTVAAQELRNRRDYNHTVAKVSNDETGVLVDSFNALMGEVARRDIELLAHRDDLARQVAERTHDLSIAKDAAVQANAAKSQFLATISHEIRTPMNGMIATAELLAEEIQSARGKRQCGVVLRSAQTLLAIINDVLDLSKIEAGQLTLEPMDCDVGEVAEDVVELFAQRALDTGLQLACYVAPDVPRQVRCDPLRLRQILTNLVNNALKFTESGGVKVAITMAGERLRFAVHDTGIGIAPEVMARLFQPFVQADSSTVRRFGGTGIGLAICRRLATAMGGEVGATSVADEGATFYLDLPVDLVTPAEVRSTRHDAPMAALLLPLGPESEVVRQTLVDLGYTLVDDPRTVELVVCGAMSVDDGTISRNGKVIRIVASGINFERSGADERNVERPVSSHKLLLALDGGRVHWTGIGKLPEATRLPRASYAGARVLAADDDPINREVLRQTLERFGVDMVEAVTGAHALELATSTQFDLIFMDGHMPGMDGFAATRAIRQWEAAHGREPVSIVALTAIVGGASEAKWDGFSDVVTKPITLAAIDACLGRWLARTASAPALGGARLANAAVLDLSVLQSIRDLQSPGDDLLQRMIGLYLEHAPVHLSRLLNARAEGLACTAKAAHALKSLSLNMGATSVAELCEQIEVSAEAGRSADAMTWDALNQAVDQASSALIEERKIAA